MRLPWPAASSPGPVPLPLTARRADTVAELAAQWINPSDVSTILMVIGGDEVQKALSQTAGKPFTPVCFSFGCVAYAFTAVVSVIGDGRLLPAPDYPATVYNLDSGYGKENRSWVVGRLLRDLETAVAKEARRAADQAPGFRITVWEALDNPHGPTHFGWSRVHAAGLAVMVLQFSIAAIPALPAMGADSGVLFITAVGTFIMQAIGALPQWVAEKLPNRQQARGTVALTTGNGSRDVVVELANADSTRKGWVWQKFREHDLLSRESAAPAPGMLGGRRTVAQRTDTDMSSRRQSRYAGGFPFGFWLTRVVLIATSVLSLLLLVNVSAPADYSWFILLIGSIGMFQNGILAGMELSPHARNLPLKKRETIRARKVMDGLMDFHAAYQGRGECLLKVSFPGPLQELEERWWSGDCDEYERQRLEDPGRGKPRRRTEEGMSASRTETRGIVPLTRTGISPSPLMEKGSGVGNGQMHADGVETV